MIIYKSAEDIEKIRVSGDLLGRTHAEVAKAIAEGVTTSKLDAIAESFIRDHGGIPAFKNYKGFPATLCISLNEHVVHGIPGNYEIKNGDLLSIDCGVILNGFHSDSAYTYPVGDVGKDALDLLLATKESLYLGIEQAKVGNRIGDIGFAVQSYVEAKGFSVVRELVGHGLGKSLHESPEVPNYGKPGRGEKILNGLVIAIEPMVNAGSRHVVFERDGWTVRTRDLKPSAHFEHTIAVVNGLPEILTTFKYIEELEAYALPITF